MSHSLTHQKKLRSGGKNYLLLVALICGKKVTFWYPDTLYGFPICTDYQHCVNWPYNEWSVTLSLIWLLRPLRDNDKSWGYCWVWVPVESCLHCKVVTQITLGRVVVWVVWYWKYNAHTFGTFQKRRSSKMNVAKQCILIIPDKDLRYLNVIWNQIIHTHTLTHTHTHVSYIHRDDVVILMPFDASIFYFHGLSALWILPFHTTKLLVSWGILLKLVWLHIFSTQALLRFLVQAVTFKKSPYISHLKFSGAYQPRRPEGLSSNVPILRPAFRTCATGNGGTMECGFVAGVVWLERMTCMFASSWLLMIQNLKNHKSPLMSTCMPMSKSLIISITHVNYWIYTVSIWWISQQNHHDQHSNTPCTPFFACFLRSGFSGYLQVDHGGLAETVFGSLALDADKGEAYYTRHPTGDGFLFTMVLVWMCCWWWSMYIIG